MYGLEGIEKLLKEMEERNRKYEIKRHNKQIGYAPKCKVCNSEYLDDIEKLREQNYTYEEILEELGITDISIMSLSRHFQNHYPKSQDYKEKQQIQMLENIKEAYLKYPFLEDYFKDKPLEYLEEFNQSKGFCMDKFSLCKYIPNSTVKDGYGAIICLAKQELKEIDKIKNGYSFREDEEIAKLKQVFNDKFTICLSCRSQIQEDRLTLLEKIVTYNFLNIAPEDKELYFNLLQFNGTPEEFIQTLTEAKEGNPAK